MRKKIAIIGASYLQLPLYLKAKELEIDTIGFAWDAGAVAMEYCTKFYSISTVAKEEILEVCLKEKIDGILTIATDVAVPTVCYVADKMGLIANSIKSAELSTNKFLMRQKFKESGLKSPLFFKIESIDELAIISDKLKFPVIVKPVDRSGSKGVAKVNNLIELQSATIKALNDSLTNKAIIEEFIVGKEVSVETISYNGVHKVLTITDKVTSGSPHFVELEHHQPSQFPEDILLKIESDTEKALNALDIKFGASHPEFLIAEDGIYIIEVGARMGGDFIGSDLVYLSTGYDFLKGVIDVALGTFSNPKLHWKKAAGIYFYSIQTPQIGIIIKKHPHVKDIVKCEITSSSLKYLSESSDRSGYLIYQSSKKLLF